MNKDFRVAITFADHPKTHKLMRRCGDKACWCLMRLWGFVAANKPDGNLGSMDAEDVEIAAGWDGEEGKFVSALVDLRMLEGEPGAYSVHDWTDHNEYAVHAKARSEKASAAARSRWGNAQTCSEHATSNAPSMPKQCPSPTPTPVPEEKNSLSSSVVLSPAQPPAAPQAQDFESEFQSFPELDGMPIEFQDLARGYPGPVDTVPAYSAFMARRKDPRFQIQRVLDDVLQREKSEEWTRDGGRWIPKLSKYLAEERWKDRSRASPQENYPWKAKVEELDRKARAAKARASA